MKKKVKDSKEKKTCLENDENKTNDNTIQDSGTKEEVSGGNDSLEKDIPKDNGSGGNADEFAVEVEDEIAKYKKKAEDNYDLFLRKSAEFENFSKRMIKERSENRKFANENIIKNFLPVLDSLNRAITAAESGSDYDALHEGVKITLGQFISALKKEGVEEIESIGQTFDPLKHDAIRMIETEDQPENIIIEEHQKCYSLNSRIIQHAKVGVTKSKS